MDDYDKFSERWWERLMSGRKEPAKRFNGDTPVLSEMAARALVLDALKSEEGCDESKGVEQ